MAKEVATLCVMTCFNLLKGIVGDVGMLHTCHKLEKETVNTSPGVA